MGCIVGRLATDRVGEVKEDGDGEGEGIGSVI